LFQVVEIEPQTTWIKSGGPQPKYRAREEVVSHLLSLPGRKLIHSIGTPVGGSVRPEPTQLELLRETIETFSAPWASDHLSFNQTPEFSTGFFLPPRQTPEGIKAVVTSIGDLTRALSVPIAVETGVNYLRVRNDELPDGEFVRRVVEEAGCGLLLDLHNIFTNALNGRQSIEEFLEQIPRERVWEIHLAGGMEVDSFWLDAHSGAIPDALYAVTEKVIPELPNLGAIVFEIFPSFVPEVGLELVEEQILRLHALWEKRASPIASRTLSPLPPVVLSAPDGDPLPESWERALGALVNGRPANNGIGQTLENDPGVRVIRGLIEEFRASAIVGTLRLTSRLLMLALGVDPFRTILRDYWSKVPPQAYGSLEAQAFAAYLRESELQVPYLAKILEFEQAAMQTLADDVMRVVEFDFEPLPLLRALAEGRLPDQPSVAGKFEIELTADGPAGVGGLDIDETREAYPFH